MRRIAAVALIFLCLIAGLSVIAMAQDDAHTHSHLTAHGTITAIDLGHSTFTTHSKAHGNLTFTPAAHAVILDDGKPTTFGALKVGDVVQVRYAAGSTSPLEAERVDIVATAGHH
jgi:hypothetical protein